jgi:hypothetical protein
MQEENKNNQDIWNIFDDFSIDDNLKKEVQSEEQKASKDIFFYLWKTNIVFSGLNVILVLLLIIASSYIFIQRISTPWMYSFLEPLCSIFVWRADIYNAWCSSVTYALNDYNIILQNEEKSQADILIPLVQDIYAIEDFFTSRRVTFALDTSVSRLRPLEILESFDLLQSDFAPIDKLEVFCPEISINNVGVIDFTCQAHSSNWDRSLTRLQDGIRIQTEDIWGTSISKAINFIDFIENSPWSRFRIIERPLSFSAESVQFWNYTRRTSFRFTAEYQSEALIY